MRLPWRKRKPVPHESSPYALAARDEADEALRQLRETRRRLTRDEESSDIFDDELGLKRLSNREGEDE